MAGWCADFRTSLSSRIVRPTLPFNCERLTQKRAVARSLLHFKAADGDGFLDYRARRL
jgi:hypothetical protein